MKGVAYIQKFIADDFFANHPLQWLYVGAIVLNAAMWVAAAVFFPPSDDPIVLYYNVFLGIDPSRVGSWQMPYAIPGIGLFCIVVQSVFAWYFFHQKDRVVADILLFSTVLLQCAGCIALAAIVLINQ